MKKIMVYSMLIIGLAACKKNETPGTEPNPAANNYLRMKVDGVSVEIRGDEDNKATLIGEIIGVGYVEPTSGEIYEYFSCTKAGATPNATGTYTFGDGSTGQMAYRKVLSPTTGIVYVSQSDLGHATLSITKIKQNGGINSINGTFSGTLYTINGNDSIVVTEGEFFDEGTN